MMSMGREIMVQLHAVIEQMKEAADGDPVMLRTAEDFARLTQQVQATSPEGCAALEAYATHRAREFLHGVHLGAGGGNVDHMDIVEAVACMAFTAIELLAQVTTLPRGGLLFILMNALSTASNVLADEQAAEAEARERPN